jgi:hypothetical protein
MERSWQHFLRMLVPRVCLVIENVFAILMETQGPLEGQTYLSKLIQSFQFVHFNP